MEKQKKEIKEEKKATFSMGAKNPKKEINIQLRPRHLVGIFVFLMVVSFLVLKTLASFGVFEVEGMKIGCTDGGYEEVLENKTFYCGEHYTVLKETKQYKYMTNIIYGSLCSEFAKSEEHKIDYATNEVYFNNYIVDYQELKERCLNNGME